MLKFSNLLDQCIECNKCVKGCGFLELYGNPKEIDRVLSEKWEPAIPYSCSLCSACEVVCPVEVPIRAYFLAARRHAVDSGTGPLPQHKGLLSYEKAVSSKLLTGDWLPAGCRRVLFPGCAAIGKAPETVRRLHCLLDNRDDPLGLVLDCCLKISHDLGRQEYFLDRFQKLCRRLSEAGIKEIMTICPSCTENFRNYSEFKITPVYRALADADMELGQRLKENLSVHDPCVLRQDEETQIAVRQVLNKLGQTVSPDKLTGKSTICCGEGGAVACLAPELAVAYRERRLNDAGGEIVVYCYACRDYLDPDGTLGVRHILELVCGAEYRHQGLKTWLNRLKMKLARKKISAGIK